MTETDTIGRVSRPRGVLSQQTSNELAVCKAELARWEREYRETAVRAVAESSFTAVAEATGLSKDTLQRWKREACK